MMEFVLGAAQLGMLYGINNKTGVPRKQEIFQMLEYAIENGVSLIDTAHAYGNSELVLGEFMRTTGNQFRVCTKVGFESNRGDIESQIRTEAISSMNRLGVDHLDYLLIHDCVELKKSKDAWNTMKKLKMEGLVGKVGVSIYSPSDFALIDALNETGVDAIQIPFNVLDKRWLECDLDLYKARHGIEVFTRSVYLQGLFFADEKKQAQIHLKAPKYVKLIKDFCEKSQIDLDEFLVQYVKKQMFADGIVIGCETIGQLKRNLDIFHRNRNAEIESFIENELITLNCPEESIINPSLWNRQ